MISLFGEFILGLFVLPMLLLTMLVSVMMVAVPTVLLRVAAMVPLMRAMMHLVGGM